MAAFLIGSVFLAAFLQLTTNQPRIRNRNSHVWVTQKGSLAVPLEDVIASLNFLKSRQEAYEETGREVNWHLRGIAHLYEHKRVLLVARHLVNRTITANINQPRHSIRIDNVFQYQPLLPTQESPVIHHSNHSRLYTKAPPNCDRLSIWVRVRGPEVFAGKAKTVWLNQTIKSKGIERVSSYCYWSFDFNPTEPGEYRVDTKVMLWDAVNHTFSKQCVYNKGTIPPDMVQKFPTHGGFKGFKLYSVHEACCEACSRQVDPPCQYWSTPPKNLSNPYYSNNGCEFYFDANVSLPFRSRMLGDLPENRKDNGSNHRDLILDMREIPLYHGYPRPGPVAYYLGCGWNTMFTLDFPCLSAMLDDKVYMRKESFLIGGNSSSSRKGSFRRDNSKINKQSDNVDVPGTNVSIPVCKLDAEVRQGSAELAGRWVKQSWPDNATCPHQFKMRHYRKSMINTYDGNHPHCWFRDDLARAGMRCQEINCGEVPWSSKWKSDFCEENWMGVWRRYDCDYYEYTDAQLEQCFQARRIKRFNISGVSIANYLQDYFEQRLNHLRLYDNEIDGVTVTLTTLGLIHMVTTPEHKFETWLKSFRNHSLDDKNLIFLVSGYYLASEREIHAHMEKMHYFNDRLRSVMIPKGYRYLNAFDLSAAMSFEVAGQLDGMHLVGPTCKMVITKMLHHLCSDVIPGSRI